MVRQFIKSFIRSHLLYYTLGILALVSSGVLQLALPKMLGHIVDLLTFRTSTLAHISWLTLGMLGLAALVFCLKFCWRYLLLGRARDLECFLRDRLFSHLQSLPVKFFHSHKTGDLMAYAINDLNAIRRAFAFGLVFFIDGFIMNSFSLVVMSRSINFRLTAISVIPLAVALFVILRLRTPLRRRFARVVAFSAKSQRMPLGASRRMRIQAANITGSIFSGLPRLQQTKPSSGRPSSAREGGSASTSGGW